MSNAFDPKVLEHQPLSTEERARAVTSLGWDTLDLPGPTSADAPRYEFGELRRMTATQRFWLAFTGKPGSSGRAGRSDEPGLPRAAIHQGNDDAPFGIPRQRGPASS